jgi:hypothetical protein
MVTKKIAAGMLLAASVASADVVLDDFASGWAGRNKFGGPWIADADSYICNPVGSTNCGTSTVTDPVLGEDVVKNSANVPTTYDGVGSIISKIKVSADVSATQAWAYAGWVMDIVPADTTGAGPEPWNQPQWERKNDIDISGCTALEVKFAFAAQRQIWIEIYNPQQEKLNPAAPPPQYGWRRFTSADDVMQTFTLNLTGLGSPVQKWTGTATDPALDLKHISRVKFLYEGQKGSAVVSPAPYDAVEHTFQIGGVTLKGGTTCSVKGVANGIASRGLEKSGLSVSEAAGMLSFANLAGMGDLKVQVLDLTGKVMSQGIVNQAKPVMQVSGMKNGVYAVKVAGSKLSRTFSITHLN